MRRLAANLGALVCALALPGAALAGTAATPQIHQATGIVTTTGWSSLTIQTAGRRMGVINAMTMTANAITKKDYTYVWGGGHAEAGVASVGIKGPGYNGRTAGYDCSGSVAAVLSGAGLWPAGSPVPNDAGVIAQLRAEHAIARGAGTPPYDVTLYDDPGVHIFMSIDGRFFGTSDGGGGGTPKGGAGWLDDGAPDAATRAYKQYHVIPSRLRNSTTYGHSLTFETGGDSSLTAAAQVGDKLHVSYRSGGSGRMIVTALTYVGSVTTTGTVTSIADGSFAIQTSSGQALTFSTGTVASLTSGLEVGDQVQVTYTSRAGTLTARVLTVTAPPAPAPAPAPAPTVPTPASGTGTTSGETTTPSGSPSGNWNGGNGSWGNSGYGG